MPDGFRYIEAFNGNAFIALSNNNVNVIQQRDETHIFLPPSLWESMMLTALEVRRQHNAYLQAQVDRLTQQEHAPMVATFGTATTSGVTSTMEFHYVF